MFNTLRLWNNRLVLTLVCLLISASPLTVVAEQIITLNTAIAKTLENNPELVALGYHVQIQEGLLAQAQLAPSPELSLEVEDVLGTGNFSNINAAQTTLSIGWVLERGIRQRRVDVASSNVSFASTKIETMRIDKSANTARYYLDCLSNQVRYDYAKEAVALAESIVDAVTARVNASKSPRAELARAKADLAMKELELEDHNHELLSSYRRLAAQWGETEPQFTHVEGKLLTLPKTESFDKLITRLDRNSEIQELLSQRRLNETQLHLANAQSKSPWRVSAGVRRFEQEDDQALVLGLTIPLTYKNRNQGEIAARQAALDKIDADTRVVDVKIKTQLFILYEELKHSFHRATALREEVIPNINQAVDDSKRAYERGIYSFLDWQIVQKELLAANAELVDAMTSAHLHVIEIERLTGEKITQLH